jgi:hypothetical protein
MNTNKITIILLGAILVVGIGVLIVSSQKEVNPEISVDTPDVQVVGQVGYNELGNRGMTHTTVNVGIQGGNQAAGSTTAYKILSENFGRMYAQISLGVGEKQAIRLYFGTTTYSGGATTTLASSTDYWTNGKELGSTTEMIYTIDGDNLWQGEIWGISTTTTTTVRVIYK